MRQTRNMGEQMENTAGVDENDPSTETMGIFLEFQYQPPERLGRIDRIEHQAFQSTHCRYKIQFFRS